MAARAAATPSKARRPDRIAGWRLAALIASAVAAAVLAAWWIVAPNGEPESVGQVASDQAASSQSQPWGASPFGATVAAPPAEGVAPRLETPRPEPSAERSPAPKVATPVPTPATPFSYVGQWMEAGRLAVILAHEGRSITVRGPGPLGGGYEVQSIDERRLVIMHLPSGTMHVMALRGAAAVGPRALAKGMPLPTSGGDETEDTTAPAVAARRPNRPAPAAASTEEEPSN